MFCYGLPAQLLGGSTSRNHEVLLDRRRGVCGPCGSELVADGPTELTTDLNTFLIVPGGRNEDERVLRTEKCRWHKGRKGVTCHSFRSVAFRSNFNSDHCGVTPDWRQD